MKTITEKLSLAKLVVLLVALFCLLPLNTVQAVSGTCNARYEVVVTQVNGRPMNKVIQFGEFRSMGRGRMPIGAAIRAKENAEHCMQSQWYNRQNGMTPRECMDQQRISGYTMQKFERTLQREVCRALKPLPCRRGKLIFSTLSLRLLMEGRDAAPA